MEESESVRDASVIQPLPTQSPLGASVAVTPLVIVDVQQLFQPKEVIQEVVEDLEARSQLGVETYGTVLFTHNGRDSLLDAYQEGLDMAKYLKQHLLETDMVYSSGYLRLLNFLCLLKKELDKKGRPDPAVQAL